MEIIGDDARDGGFRRSCRCGLVPLQRDRDCVHRPWLAVAERLDRAVQSALPRQAPLRLGVQQLARYRNDYRGLRRRRQREPVPDRLRRPRTSRVRRQVDHLQSSTQRPTPVPFIRILSAPLASRWCVTETCEGGGGRSVPQVLTRFPANPETSLALDRAGVPTGSRRSATTSPEEGLRSLRSITWWTRVHQLGFINSGAAGREQEDREE